MSDPTPEAQADKYADQGAVMPSSFRHVTDEEFWAGLDDPDPKPVEDAKGYRTTECVMCQRAVSTYGTSADVTCSTCEKGWG